MDRGKSFNSLYFQGRSNFQWECHTKIVKTLLEICKKDLIIKMIAKYTKQTVKLKKQQDYIKYWESAIQQAKKDYSSVYDNF